MNTQPKKSEITIVIPTYNRESQVEKAVLSVLQETRVPLLVYIFDNASSDNTEAVVSKLKASDPRVHYFRNETNIGLIGNFQRALGSVQSTYFIPLADDDWILPDFIYEAYQILERDEALAAAVFLTECRDETGRLHGYYPGSVEKRLFGLVEPSEHLENWMTYGHYSWSSILWRSSVLDFIKPKYLHAGLPSDVDFQVQIFSQFPVYVVNKPGAVFLLHQSQGSKGQNLAGINNWVKIFRRLDSQIGKRRLFELRKYLSLRAMRTADFRSAWMPPAPDLSRSTLIRSAIQAGLVLNDWDFALQLAEQIPAMESTELEKRLFFLPKLLESDQEAAPAQGHDELRLALLKWLGETRTRAKQSIEKNASLEAEKAALEQRNEELRQQLHNSNEQLHLSNQLLDASDHKLAALTAAHDHMNNYLIGLVTSRVFRFLLKLGLLPPPRPPEATVMNTKDMA